MADEPEKNIVAASGTDGGNAGVKGGGGNNGDDPSKMLTNPGEQHIDNAKENTRSQIAHNFIYAYFGVIFLSMIIGVMKCWDVKDFKDMLLAISGILSGPLGFIIGYYFKAGDNNNHSPSR